MLYTTRILAVVVGVLAISLAGCAKKNPETAPVAKDEAATPSAPKQDVFDEFYQEGGTTAKKAEKSTETFSTTTSAPKSTTSSRKKLLVKSQPVTHQASTTPVSAAFEEDGRYVVQVATVASSAEADRRVQKLKSQGYPAYAVEVSNPTPTMQGTCYRVRIGGFSSASAAKSFGEEAFGSSGYWVDKRSNDLVGMEGRDAGSSTSYPTAGSSAPAPATSDWGSTPASSPAAGAPEKAPASTATQSWNETPSSTPPPAPAAAVKPAPASSSPSSDWGSPSSAAEPAPAPTPAAPAPKPAPKPAPTPTPEPAPSTPSTTSGTGEGDGWGSTDDAGW